MPGDHRSSRAIRYFVRRHGKESGPHAKGKIERALADGRLETDDEFRRADRDSWHSLADWPPRDEAAGLGRVPKRAPLPRPTPPPPPIRNGSSLLGSVEAPPRVEAEASTVADQRRRQVREPRPMTPSYVALLGTIGFLLLVIGILIGRLSDAERSDRSPDEEPLAAAPSASFRHDASAASASESENERDGAGRRGSVPSAVPPPIDDDVDALADDMPDDIEAPAAPSVEAASDAEIGGLSEVEMGAASEVEPMGPPLLEPPILGPGRGEPTTLRQSVQFQRMPRYEVLDNPLIQELHYLIESDLTVHPADIDGYRDVEQVVREAKVLNADELSRASLENAVAKLVGWQFDYRINRFGEVIDWRGGPPATPESDEVTVDGNHGVLVTTVIDEDGWKELATLTFFRPPSDERGERPFERQMTHDFGPLGRWWGMTTFAPRGRDGTLRRFDYRHAMTYEAPEEDRSNGLPFEIVSARLTPRLAAGRITYDTSTEQVREVVERFEVEGEVTARMLGNTIPLQFVEPQTIILQIDDRNRE